MVKIRLARFGRKKMPFWRIGAFDSRTRRDGKPIEYLGSYDPHQEKAADKVKVNKERAEHWLKHGAQPTRTVAKLLRTAGVDV